MNSFYYRFDMTTQTQFILILDEDALNYPPSYVDELLDGGQK